MGAELGAEDGSRRGRTLVRAGVAALVAVLLGLPGVVGQAGAEPVVGTRAAASESRLPEVIRLSGANREETAAAVAQHRGTDWAVLARSDRPLDAVAANATWPVLFVPPSGSPSPGTRRVLDSLRTVGPGSVVVAPRALISDRRVTQLLGKAPWTRLDQPDPSSISVAAASAGDEELMTHFRTLLVAGYEPLAQSAVARRTRDALVLVPRSGLLPKAALKSKVHITSFEWVRSWAVGPASSVSDRTLRIVDSFMAGQVPPRKRSRVSGRDRYETAALLNDPAFPEGASEAYLVNGVSGVDAAILSSEHASPVLLVPPCGALPDSVRQRLRTWRPSKLVVVGGTDQVCDTLVAAAASAYDPRPSEIAREVTVRDGGACLLTDTGAVQCWGNSLSGTRSPRTLPGMASGVRSIAGGAGRCAVVGSGTVVCWNQTSVKAGLPPSVVAGLEDGVDSIAVEEKGGPKDQLLAVKTDGTVWRAELPRTDSADPLSMSAAPLTGTRGIPSVTTNGWTSCGLDRAGDVWCWGQLRFAGQSRDYPPTRLANMPSDIAEIQLQELGLVIRTSGGTLFTVGDSGDWDRARPAPRHLPLARRLTEANSPCYISVTGELLCRNLFGPYRAGDPLGNYQRQPTATPVRMAAVEGVPGCAVVEDGRVQCFGESYRAGASGNGSESGAGRTTFVIGYGG